MVNDFQSSLKTAVNLQQHYLYRSDDSFNGILHSTYKTFGIFNEQWLMAQFLSTLFIIKGQSQ